MSLDLHSLIGCTDEDTYPLLRTLAAAVPGGQAIVELGTYRGKSACFLAAGARAGGGAHVWTVDPHDLPGYRTTTGKRPGTMDFTRTEIRLHAESQIRRAGLQDRITMIRDFSERAAAAWDGPRVGLLFIDGDHRQGAVRRDFRSWQPHLARGAVVVFDDYSESHPGVPLAAAGLVDRGVLEIVEVRGRVAIARERR